MELSRNKVTRSAGKGLVVLQPGCRVERNRVTLSGTIGLHLVTTDNDVVRNRVHRTLGPDLVDGGEPGANRYDRNRFGNAAPPQQN